MSSCQISCGFECVSGHAGKQTAAVLAVLVLGTELARDIISGGDSGERDGFWLH